MDAAAQVPGAWSELLGREVRGRPCGFRAEGAPHQRGASLLIRPLL